MTGFFAVPDWALLLARRVLYGWVRTTVLFEHPEQTDFDPAKPVCYVLNDRHLSDLLVLYEETRRAGLSSAETPLTLGQKTYPRAVFSLRRKPVFRATPRERYAHSSLMMALVHESLADPSLDVQIVPVVILWGRHPAKQDSILKALFSETWRQPGRLHRMLTILLQGRNVLVRFNAPIALRTLAHQGLDEEKALRKLSRVLRVHFRRQRLMAIGPDLSHRNTQINTLLEAPAVCSAIALEAQTHGLSLAQAQGRARRFALEIASDYSYSTLRALELFLTWLWGRLYDGIEVLNIDRVTRIAPSQGVVYVPTHRSHLDYLLLSYSLGRQGLTPPHIAAGANLNFPLVGTILRRSGAFFLRRSLKGEALYAAVFHEYLHLILIRGFPLEYFIEGGRSRSGRTLVPKAGILGMTISSFIREHTRPLVFVPVYIGYEKLIEGRTYLRELAGKPKQSESLWDLLRSIRQIKRVFGKVYINFGEPLDLASFLAQHHTPAVGFEDPGAREATRGAATELARRLNAAAVVNPVNLIALALLSAPSATVNELALERLVAHLQALLADAPYSPSIGQCRLDARQIVAYALRLGVAERVAADVSDGQGDRIRLTPNEAPLQAYFRNNILHLIFLPALIACLLSHHRRLGMPQLTQAIAAVYVLIETELFLSGSVEQLPEASAAVVAVLLQRGLLGQETGGALIAPAPNTAEFAELQWLGQMLNPIVEPHLPALAEDEPLFPDMVRQAIRRLEPALEPV